MRARRKRRTFYLLVVDNDAQHTTLYTRRGVDPRALMQRLNESLESDIGDSASVVAVFDQDVSKSMILNVSGELFR